MDQARTLTAAVSKDGTWFVARCLEIEVASQGETIDEALVNLREALELYFEDGTLPLTSFTHSSPRLRSASRRESGLAADLRSGSHSST